MKLNKRNLVGAVGSASALVVVGIAFAAWYVYEPEIPRIPRPAKASFGLETIARGEQLATVGDCIVCHTAPEGMPFAGARSLPTPFGTLYSNNITPDEATGIGNWSEDAFKRAMKRGVARDGMHLYPALPYEHFTHVSDDDLQAIYAFLMTRQAVLQKAPDNRLLPGLGFRPLLAGWKLLFLHEASFQTDTTQTDEWNRGKYLVDGLGHCGGCHTPRNLAGGEERGREFAGGVAEGWNAPPLDSSNPAAATWTVSSLFKYLKTGSDAHHGTAAGPMGPVAEGLSRLNDADVQAISVYIASKMHPGSGAAPAVISLDNSVQAAKDHPLGAQLFEGACAGCHGNGAPMSRRGIAPLSAVSALKADDPRNAVQALMHGMSPPSGHGPYMPPFADNLTDEKLSELLLYVRKRFTDAPAWTDLDAVVAAIRTENAKE